jgi:hypothetical protein
MLAARFLLIATPVAYLALTGYLIAQVRPLPIAVMPRPGVRDGQRTVAV